MPQQSSLAFVFPRLAREPLGIVDVGSRWGLTTALAEIAPLCRAVGFEPDPVECARLNQEASHERLSAAAVFLPFALGERQTRQVMHLCREPGASSLYAPNRALLDRFPGASRVDVMDAVVVEVTSLDALSRGPQAGALLPVDFMKLDTQGSELDILKGASGVLALVQGIEVEVEFAPIYQGQPLFRDVDAFLASNGFTLYKLRRVHWVRRGYAGDPRGTAGQVMFADALYLRDPLGAPASERGVAEPRQAEALVAIAMCYDLHDVALELVADSRTGGALEGDRIRSHIAARERRMRNPFRHVRSPVDLARWAWRTATPFLARRDPLRGWARADRDFYTRA